MNGASPRADGGIRRAGRVVTMVAVALLSVMGAGVNAPIIVASVAGALTSPLPAGLLGRLAAVPPGSSGRSRSRRMGHPPGWGEGAAAIS